MQPCLWNMKSFDTLVTISWKMDSRDRFYGFSLLFNIFAEKNTYYAGIMLDAPSMVLSSKLCRHNVSDPTSRQYHAGILIFRSTSTVNRNRSVCLPHKRDCWPAAEWKQYSAGWVDGGLIVIRSSNTCLKSFRTISLNSEGMLCDTNNFYFILITFSIRAGIN